jgi:quinol monooxygenase YgiN
MAGAIEPIVVTWVFDASDVAGLGAVLARYVVLTRRAGGCRNVDLLASATHPARSLVVEKWDTADAQRAHLDSAVAVEMAAACEGLLAARPQVDVWEPVSAHDVE